jgi:hypothetical protein
VSFLATTSLSTGCDLPERGGGGAARRRDRDQSVDADSFPCFGFPPTEDLIYGWAPGQNAIQFPKGGLRVEPDDQFVLQIHYNNGAGVENVEDSSGVRVYHTGSADREIVMADLGPQGFVIPPKQRFRAEHTCEVKETIDVVASFPHMHEIGSEFHQNILRRDGSTESLIDLTGWSFEAQLTYRTPVTLRPGDRLKTSCVWENPRDEAVTFGVRTKDEMCYNFMYVTPPDDDFCR